ncbi:nitroreductase [Corynebacterium pseudotuberculosis]|uniref:nitroreductase family protein n=1 Tax=Corynebacterium pseudotuberculosis TaxID=1719 RepID=UPI0002592BAE|nr:nitroreductase family protein [Corynebacterium pseudotuberculosis]AFH91420.1 nitroreductase [Corynebacterium pseudotuberculosis 31]APB11431.1 nitroreductase [Corynebacterium pseudotuberculosis]APB13475.1 nitroreductase [Corynebacterium pseudotuberculosis]APB15518.1 nitroreductase [Corynebacterium pseudotuberculosis]APB17564.1 nitroreductase [Corynebacterium pseudotuberculosis]
MDRRTADFWNTADNAAAEYTQLILERKEYGMISPAQGPFWNHQPYPVKVVPDALCFPVRAHTMSSTDLAIARAIDDSLSRTHLRAEIDCNSPTRTRTEVQSFQWSRNTASGGGLYPINLYRYTPGGSHLPAGLYVLNPITSQWQQLMSGALPQDAWPCAQGETLLVTVEFWRSAFKYGDFAYQATSVDVGIVVAALVSRLDATAGPVAIDWSPDEHKLSDFLGIDPLDEGIYCTITLPRDISSDFFVPSVDSSTEVSHTHSGTKPVRFPTTVALQKQRLGEAPNIRVPFSAKRTLAPTPVAIRRGSSSFGRYSGKEIGVDVLSRMVQRGRATADSLLGVSPESDLFPCVHVAALCVNVQGLSHSLIPDVRTHTPVSPVRFCPQLPELLLNTYLLKNYDPLRSAAVLVLCADLQQIVLDYGASGYRWACAEIGFYCQSAYAVAAQEQVSAGAVLGFDARYQRDYLGLPDNLIPVLNILVGVDRPHAQWRNSLL